jgi:hypothetical protein
MASKASMPPTCLGRRRRERRDRGAVAPDLSHPQHTNSGARMSLSGCHDPSEAGAGLPLMLGHHTFTTCQR